jgi:hypothetical protein
MTEAAAIPAPRWQRSTKANSDPSFVYDLTLKTPEPAVQQHSTRHFHGSAGAAETSEHAVFSPAQPARNTRTVFIFPSGLAMGRASGQFYSTNRPAVHQTARIAC